MYYEGVVMQLVNFFFGSSESSRRLSTHEEDSSTSSMEESLTAGRHKNGYVKVKSTPRSVEGSDKPSSLTIDNVASIIFVCAINIAATKFALNARNDRNMRRFYEIISTTFLFDVLASIVLMDNYIKKS